MKGLKNIVTLMLLLLTLTAAAQQEVQRQGCRRGTPRSQHGMTLRSAQSRQLGGDFYTGERHQLTVLVSFADLSFEGDETATMTKWDNIMNTKNYQEEPYKGSVRDYFYAQSYGTFDLTFDLQYVQLTEGVARYASTANEDENSQYLVNDIMDILTERDINWSLYDWDDDGYVNQLLIVFAGKGMNDGGGTNSIWAHQWWLSDHLNKSTEDTSDYCEPRTVTYGDKTYSVDCYCAVPESGRSYATFGTLCHEFSHCFGFPDFYFSSTSYVKEWDLMDYGNYNGKGYIPCSYSAHERWLMGWLPFTELSEGTTVTDMPALSDKPVAYLIRNDAYENEFYVVENRQQKDWDAGLPGSGIVIFHIDFDNDAWLNKYVGPNHPEFVDRNGISYKESNAYTIIPANANASTSASSGWPYPYLNNNELTNTSSPASTLNHKNSQGEFLMNKSLTNISVTDGLASFVFGENSIHFAELLNKATFFHSTKNFRLPTGVTASVVTKLSDDGKLVCEKIVDQTLRNSILPANTPVILTREDTSLPSTVTITEVSEGESYTGDNLLNGYDEDCSTDIYGTDYLFYKLALGHSASDYQSIYSWYWGAENGGAFHIEAHKAWLALPMTNAASQLSMINASELTSLREIGNDKLGIGTDVYYDLSGHRVAYPKKGIFILNGRKIVIR